MGCLCNLRFPIVNFWHITNSPAADPYLTFHIPSDCDLWRLYIGLNLPQRAIKTWQLVNVGIAASNLQPQPLLILQPEISLIKPTMHTLIPAMFSAVPLKSSETRWNGCIWNGNLCCVTIIEIFESPVKWTVSQSDSASAPVIVLMST